MSDVEARAERRRTRTQDDMVGELGQTAWDAATAATAAGNPPEARRWLERAHRILPQDALVATTLAANLLAAGQLARAAALFQSAAQAHGLPNAWAGLATCAHLAGDATRARAALAEALRRRVPDNTLRALADAVAPDGWCGLDTDGVLHRGAASLASVLLDGTPVSLRWTGRTARLPAAWRTAARLEAATAHGPACGSPLPLRPFAGVEGFVEQADGGGVAGWAWFPTDPAREPTVLATGPVGQRRLVLAEPTTAADQPHARPRRLALSAAEVAALGTPLAVRGPDGRHLLGSPLDPGLEARAAARPGHPGFAPVWADVLGPPPPAPPARRPPVDVVIPVHGGRAETLACLDSVLASALPRFTRIIVVDDASPDPDLVSALAALARARRITLLRLPENQGFPGAAGTGLRAAAGRDVVLLNSDTLVPPLWLDRLRAAAYAAPDIGTATPFTNDGTLLSYPDPAGGNPVPDRPATLALDALAQQANGAAVVDIPVGVGFCLFIRRDCLDRAGPLREDLFAQGYGEENDLCLRARHHGFRNVAVPGVFVSHAGATSFGLARAALLRRNAAILARLHPGYDALVAAHAAADPLHPARRRLDALRWASPRPARARRPGAVLIVTHAGGGGVDQVVARRAAAARAENRRPILLQPWRSATASGLRVHEPGGPDTPNLAYALPAEWPDLLRLLRAERPARVELHHLLGHLPEVAELPARLGVPAISVVHDYARFCPRIALVGTGRRYCGEPDLAGCEQCIADLGSLLEDDPTVPELRRRSAAELAAAEAVIAPSHDAATRIARHFPGIRPRVEPWSDDDALPPLAPAPQGPVRRIAVVGAIGIEKGYDVLLGCVRDARARGLALAFTVVGFTADDARLMAAGPVHVTGRYAEADAVALIREEAAQAAFIPSIWPETWCFALTRAWEAGLAAAVFDLGAPAERVRRTGRGWLLPLGLAAARINDALLRLAPDRPPGQSPLTFI